MAHKSRATFAKRQREIARQERARDKAARRVERKETKPKYDRSANDDPDIAGIVPGPQPLPYEVFEDDAQPALEQDEGGEDEA